MKKNEGYSLVEMLIVIAIIMVLTGMAYITIRILSSASARDKAIDFDTEIATLAAKSRNMDAKFVNPDDSTDEYDQFSLFIYRPHGGDEVYEAPGYYSTTTNNYYVDVPNGKKYNRKISVQYDGSLPAWNEIHYRGSSIDIIAAIRYNRRGECVAGYGNYKFTTDRSSGNAVASTKIRQNGSHETK